jgi:proteasome assembly chaperone (PAC2) family protein
MKINIDNQTTWYQKPRLTSPLMIIGFEGWPDAGKASSGALSYLLNKFQSTLLAELNFDEFYVLSPSGSENKRPLVTIEQGLVKSSENITTTIRCVKQHPEKPDLILVYGPEPDRQWNKYAQSIINIAKKMGVPKIVAFGGTFDAIPHTAQPRISATFSDSVQKEELIACEIDLVNYTGPSSIHTSLSTMTSKNDIQFISLWGHTPHYIQIPNLMVIYNLLDKMNLLLKLNLDIEDAKIEGDNLYKR